MRLRERLWDARIDVRNGLWHAGLWLRAFLGRCPLPRCGRERCTVCLGRSGRELSMRRRLRRLEAAYDLLSDGYG